MKANLLQLVSSSVVLGLMAGAVTLHWHQLQQYEPSISADDASGDYRLVSARVFGDSELASGERESLDRFAVRHTRDGENREEMRATVEALSEIVSVLQELKEENRDLRDQIEEANRDQSEMRFQLETHSREFRPLNLETEPARRVESERSHPLLPPKDR